MKRSLLLIVALSSGLALAGCNDGDGDTANADSGQDDTQQAAMANQQTISGTLSFTESGEALPEDAEVTLSLSDVSLADAPAKLIVEKSIDVEQLAPTDFTLAYSADDVVVNHAHGVRAQIHDEDGNLLWTTTDANLVKVGNDSDQAPITVILHPVGPDGSVKTASLQQAQEQLLSSGDEPNAAEQEVVESANPEAVSEEVDDIQEPSAAEAAEAAPEDSVESPQS
ncbi:YbaY family lipoprotein [Halomonas huangheensis]|uniref:Uncharacterized protein n=1 Tax=Halomonas huangheensis TaxID=1178482 RepID=W1N397_9GAMM|nr:YbaY family lipoprotein [Halomonas huangheensis]ALM51521.1 hypothetical protein AR456_03850 [Halomonas huangheensis]ERL49988.1 hypothetical protein BJB45_02355 [Halomonas huangheensis]